MSEKVRLFAKAAHAAVGQVRKYTGEPYIVHPADVVRILWTYASHVDYSNEEFRNMENAAWLHDVVEDTAITLDVIREEFGVEVAAIVGGLTSKEKPEDGNRATRKRNELIRLSKCCKLVKTVKLADLISNTRSIEEHDAHFASTYMEEKRALLDHALKDGGDPLLWAIADKIVCDYYKKLVQ